jgi:hypothetical protein
LLAEVQSLVGRYLERWPNGRLRSVTVDLENPEGVLDSIRQWVEVDPETARFRRALHARVARQELPLGFLASVAHRSYTEVLVRRGFGTLPSWSPDVAEGLTSITAAERARDTAVLADVSALVVLSILDEPDKAMLLNVFRVVEVVDASVADVRTGRDLFEARSTMTLGWDEAADSGRVTETSSDEADRLANEATALLDLVTSLHRIPAVPSADEQDEARDLRLGCWMETIRTALATGKSLWADDASLRGLARSMGVATYSTVALLEALERSGSLTTERHQDLLHALARNRVAIPMSGALLLRVAEDDRWAATGAAFALGNPAVWAHPAEARVLWRRLCLAVTTYRPLELPTWLYLSASGVGYAHPVEKDAAHVGGELLADTILLSAAQAGDVPNLLAAVRAGLATAAEDPLVAPDPLPTSITALLDAIRRSAPPGVAERFVISLFSGTAEGDRTTVLEAALKP